MRYIFIRDQAGTVTTSWQSGRQHGAQPQHHLGISLRLAPTQHNHCISRSQNNPKPLSEKWGGRSDNYRTSSMENYRTIRIIHLKFTELDVLYMKQIKNTLHY